MSKVRPSMKVSGPSPTMAATARCRFNVRPLKQQVGPLPSPDRGHASTAVLSDTAKLTPALRSGIKRVAAAKVNRHPMKRLAPLLALALLIGGRLCGRANRLPDA